MISLKSYRNAPCAGFTLIEIAIVMIIISLLLGAVLVPLGSAFEQSQRKTVRAQLEQINEALIGFAAANGRLPCPASGTSAGREDPAGNPPAVAPGGSCAGTDSDEVAHGFVPSATLGLVGETNLDGLLIDVWGNPLRYSVTQSDSDADGNPDFTSQAEMRDVRLPLLAPNIVICTSATSSVNCTATGGNGNTIRANKIPAIIFSMGRDWPDFSGADQTANAGEGFAGGSYNVTITGSSGRRYPLPGNAVFVSKSFTRIEGDDKFDDIVLWLSAGVFYSRLIQAGTLP